MSSGRKQIRLAIILEANGEQRLLHIYNTFSKEMICCEPAADLEKVARSELAQLPAEYRVTITEVTVFKHQMEIGNNILRAVVISVETMDHLPPEYFSSHQRIGQMMVKNPRVAEQVINQLSQ